MKESADILVVNFVQTVSSPISHAKRVGAVRKMLRNFPKNLTQKHWMHLWRGFYYVVWYEEMRKGGQELIEEMGSNSSCSEFITSGFKSLAETWPGIDAFRIDKYMYLIRIMLRNVLRQQVEACRNHQTLFHDDIFVKNYLKSIKIQKNQKEKDDMDHPNVVHQSFEIDANVIDYIISVTSQSVGLFLHICDIYLDELKPIIEELRLDDSSRIYHQMLLPFIKWLALIKDPRMLESIQKDIFDHLLEKLFLNEKFDTRKNLLEMLMKSIINLGAFPCFGTYRLSINDTLQSKLSELTGRSKNKVKRKAIGFDRKTKRIKYELTTETPFVRSLVPLPVV